MVAKKTLAAEELKVHVETLKGWFDNNGALDNFAVRANGEVIDPDGNDCTLADDEMANNIDGVIEAAKAVTEFLIELRRLKRFLAWAKTMPVWEAELPE